MLPGHIPAHSFTQPRENSPSPRCAGAFEWDGNLTQDVLPSLGDIILAATPDQRRGYMGSLESVLESLKQLNGALDVSSIERLCFRAKELFAYAPDSIPAISPLSYNEQCEVAEVLKETRWRFWECLYRVPLVQDLIVRDLSCVAHGKSLRGKVFEAGRESSSLNQESVEAPVEDRARDVLSSVQELREAETSHGSREEIAHKLLQVPLIPERSIMVFLRVRDTVNELMECEAKLLCCYNSIEDAIRNRDPLCTRHRTLSAACGGTATEAYGMLQELQARQARYLRVRDYLAMANLGLVRSRVSRSYRQGVVDDNDLTQRGFVSLLYAIERFDPTQGFRLSTYATKGITSSVYEESETHKHPVALSRTTVQSVHALQKALASNQTRLSIQDLELKIGASSDQVLSLLQTTLGSYSLDAPVTSESETSFGEFVSAVAPSPREIAANNERYAAALEAIDNLPTEALQTVISMFFGLRGYNAHRVEEIARHLGKRVTWVTQQRNLALRLLQKRQDLQAFR